MKIVLATNNTGKIREFSAFFSRFPFEFVSQADLNVSEVEETGLSFIENAIIKARHASRTTGLPALADDSGLSVTALHGAPGIYSARYAGKNGDHAANIQKLLNNMLQIPDDKREAQFHCALAFVAHANDPTPLVCDGKWSGSILRVPLGEYGFGYDPIFFIPELKKSAAELPLEIKNKISHRGLALQSFLAQLPEKLHESALS